MKRGGPARWNSETQSWEDGTPAPAPYTGPMPPRPSFEPSTGGPTGDAPAGNAPSGGGPSGTAGPGPGPSPYPPSAAFSASSGPSAPSSSYPSPYPGPLPDPAADPLLVPAPAPAPAYGARRRTSALVAGAAVAAIAAGAAGAYLLWGHDDAPAAARPPARAQASATGGSGDPTASTDTAQPTASTESDGSSAAVPAGYRVVHDDKGFTTAVPDGWQRSERKTGVFYTAPDDRGLVQIFEITEPETSPHDALQQASQGLAGNPGYEELSLEPLAGEAPGTDAAQLVYAYDSDRIGERVKVIDCAFTVEDGRQFAVLVLGPEADWPEQERTQQIALRAFAPTN